MRIRRQAAARRQLAAEIVELLFGEAPFEKRARVDAGRGMPLVIHDVAIAGVAGPEEMIEPDLVQRGRRRKRRNVAADAGLVLVRPQHHRNRVPSHQALDAALDLLAAWKRHFLFGGQRVDVRRVRAERQPDAAAPRMLAQLLQQLTRARGAIRSAARSRASRATPWFQWTRGRRYCRRRYFSLVSGWPSILMPFNAPDRSEARSCPAGYLLSFRT